MKSPPFRADHVGSLLRPAGLHEARAGHAEGRIDDDRLAAAEDDAIRAAIARQEAIGLKSITDGEMRRAVWSTDFLQALEGISWVEGLAQFQGGKPSMRKVLRVTGKVGFSGHPMIAHFRFLEASTSATPKMTIPSPTMLVSPTRDWRELVDAEAYASLDALYVDLAAAYRDAVRAFHEAGCRYLQFDDCAFAFLCDAEIRRQVEARGDDPDRLMAQWVELINAVLAEKPGDMTITTHMCRGNFKSLWLASGGYEPIADLLFNRLNYDAYFMEYDSERAGSFEPLELLPPDADKRIVLGLVTTKVGQLEDRDEVERRIREAASIVGLERLCLSPQCGFASTAEGNALAEEEQWQKLEAIVQIAEDVWQGA